MKPDCGPLLTGVQLEQMARTPADTRCVTTAAFFFPSGPAAFRRCRHRLTRPPTPSFPQKYTWQVVKEALRFRPAAPMVPQVAAVDFTLADGVVAPKGSLVIPSLLAPVWSGEGFPQADKFDPDRMGPERQEHIKHGKHFLTFGCGTRVGG